ncbi:flavodoxin family protein [Nocardia higoensis]|uniref:Flavodoxin family protein n=1 Tax=Nocardia higoensis TaxID=228599 RepID=A0ABS0D5I5_9NOCA|nr:flavodoxin domain-containing protein [Nocardia higoensis]MBF6353740.1 flavodoxin family protein [Nocardia higoensis]
MQVRIVYESMFGNTAEVARAIAQGFGGRAEVQVLDVVAASELPDLPVDLLIVGGPTHAFGLSRARTRLDAAGQTDRPVETEIGIREWLQDASHARAGARAAAFGTKVGKPPWLPGSAARGVGKRLRALGYQLTDEPQDFFVAGTPGPLVDGEIDRARAWGEHLASTAMRAADAARRHDVEG